MDIEEYQELWAITIGPTLSNRRLYIEAICAICSNYRGARDWYDEMDELYGE